MTDPIPRVTADRFDDPENKALLENFLQHWEIFFIECASASNLPLDQFLRRKNMRDMFNIMSEDFRKLGPAIGMGEFCAACVKIMAFQFSMMVPKDKRDSAIEALIADFKEGMELYDLIMRKL